MVPVAAAGADSSNFSLLLYLRSDMLMFQSHSLTNFDADVTTPKRDEEPGTNKSFSLTHFPKDMKNTQMKVSCVLFSRHLFICSLIFSDLQMTATQNQKAAASLQVRKAKEDFPLPKHQTSPHSGC